MIEQFLQDSSRRGIAAFFEPRYRGSGDIESFGLGRGDEHFACGHRGMQSKTMRDIARHRAARIAEAVGEDGDVRGVADAAEDFEGAVSGEVVAVLAEELQEGRARLGRMFDEPAQGRGKILLVFAGEGIDVLAGFVGHTGGREQQRREKCGAPITA